MPLRYVVVTSVDRYSNVYYFRYTLGKLFDYRFARKSDQNVSSIKDFEVLSKIKSDIEGILSGLGINENKPGKDLKTLVFEAGDSLASEGSTTSDFDNDRAWGRIVSILRTIKTFESVAVEERPKSSSPQQSCESEQDKESYVFQNFDFIRVVGIYEGDEDISSRIHKPGWGDNRLILVSDSIVELSILQRTYTVSSIMGDSSVKEERKIALTGVPYDMVTVVPPGKNITGKHERYNFHVVVGKFRRKSTYGTIFISIPREDFHKTTFIEMPILIRNRYREEDIALRIMGAALFVVGIGLIFLSTGVLNELGIVSTVVGGLFLTSDIAHLISLIAS